MSLSQAIIQSFQTCLPVGKSQFRQGHKKAAAIAAASVKGRGV